MTNLATTETELGFPSAHWASHRAIVTNSEHLLCGTRFVMSWCWSHLTARCLPRVEPIQHIARLKMAASSPRLARQAPLTSHPMRRPLKHRPRSARMQGDGRACRDVALWVAQLQPQQLPCISHKPPNNPVLTSHFRRGKALLSWDGSSERSAANKFQQSKFAPPSKRSRDEPGLKGHRESRRIVPIMRHVHPMAPALDFG
jgi:hypothetical protein